MALPVQPSMHIPVPSANPCPPDSPTSRRQGIPASVRALAKDLRVSALTVKKAYDELEREGFVTTVHGKGTFVTSANQEIMLEEKKKEVEADLEGAIRKGRSCGMSDEEITELFQIILEES